MVPTASTTHRKKTHHLKNALTLKNMRSIHIRFFIRTNFDQKIPDRRKQKKYTRHN